MQALELALSSNASAAIQRANDLRQVTLPPFPHVSNRSLKIHSQGLF